MSPKKTAILARLLIVLACALLSGGCSHDPSAQSGEAARIFDFSNGNGDIAGYQAALEAYLKTGQGKPPVVVGAEGALMANGLLGHVALSGPAPRVHRAHRSADGAAAPEGATEGHDDPLAGPEIEDLAGRCLVCEPPATPTPAPTPTATPTPTPGDEASPTPTPTESGTPAPDLETTLAPSDDKYTGTTARHSDFVCPALQPPGGCPVINGIQTFPIIQVHWANGYAYDAWMCTTGLPATRCTTVYALPFGGTMTCTNWANGSWWCNPFVAGWFPILAIQCL